MVLLRLLVFMQLFIHHHDAGLMCMHHLHSLLNKRAISMKYEFMLGKGCLGMLSAARFFRAFLRRLITGTGAVKK